MFLFKATKTNNLNFTQMFETKYYKASFFLHSTMLCFLFTCNCRYWKKNFEVFSTYPSNIYSNNLMLALIWIVREIGVSVMLSALPSAWSFGIQWSRDNPKVILFILLSDAVHTIHRITMFKVLYKQLRYICPQYLRNRFLTTASALVCTGSTYVRHKSSIMKPSTTWSEETGYFYLKVKTIIS